MVSHVIMFNGPPRSGKDFSCDVALDVCRKFGLRATTIKVAGALKDAVHASFGLQVPTNFFEDRKDRPCEELFGCTPRTEYIALSEEYLRKRHGSGHFGRVLVNRMKAATEDVILVSDCGFQDEVNLVSQYVGATKLQLIRLRRDGCAFTTDAVQDSRGYVSHVKDDIVMVNDGGTPYENKLRVTVTHLLKRVWRRI